MTNNLFSLCLCQSHIIYLSLRLSDNWKVQTTVQCKYKIIVCLDRLWPWSPDFFSFYLLSSLLSYFQFLWMPDVIIHDLVKFSKPEILNEVAALEIFKNKMVYYKIRYVECWEKTCIHVCFEFRVEVNPEMFKSWKMFCLARDKVVAVTNDSHLRK